jgi:hypothetical protein
MNYPPDLERKLLNRIDKGKGTQLTAAELDILLECGAIAMLSDAATKFRKEQCRERNRSTSVVATGFTRGRGGISKSSGMMKPNAGSEALARVQQTLGKGS